jgi:hypothetical protein
MDPDQIETRDTHKSDQLDPNPNQFADVKQKCMKKINHRYFFYYRRQMIADVAGD